MGESSVKYPHQAIKYDTYLYELPFKKSNRRAAASISIASAEVVCCLDLVGGLFGERVDPTSILLWVLE